MVALSICQIKMNAENTAKLILECSEGHPSRLNPAICQGSPSFVCRDWKARQLTRFLPLLNQLMSQSHCQEGATPRFDCGDAKARDSVLSFFFSPSFETTHMSTLVAKPVNPQNNVYFLCWFIYSVS